MLNAARYDKIIFAFTFWDQVICDREEKPCRKRVHIVFRMHSSTLG